MENKNSKGVLNKIIAIIVLIVLIAIIGGLCYGYYKKKTLNIANPIVTMEVEDFGTIKIELYPDKAPNTVKNFIKLVNEGFYDGLTFHRIIEDFMIQGGKNENEDEEIDYCIKGEFLVNGFEQNDLNLTKGTIAMARADYTSISSSLAEESYNSAATEFFIMTSDNYTHLSGYYCGFGKVIEGIDVVEKISKVEVEATEENEEESTPVNDVIISSVTVETYGIDYGTPETLEPFDYMTWLYKMYGLSN